jgi:methylase of polypeptide subunit release factors
MLKNNLNPRMISEIGCGAGAILVELSKEKQLPSDVRFIGYDISPQAIELANSRSTERVKFFCKDMLIETQSDPSDVFL